MSVNLTTAILPADAGGFPVDRSRTTPHGLRVDIQLLRGLAIILVLLHHARVPYVPGGFLGVDIFFVVSGYLMTGIVARELEEDRFRFRDFFARRARRLLPASYAMLIVTALLAPWLLDRFEYRDFVAQLAGSFGFVVNLVLWQQSDYFNSGAAFKPLLHMWSLSLEEQYYLALPLLLWLSPQRLRLPLAVGCTVTSLALCAWLVGRSPSATFYSLPTRAWELGIGSIVALLVRSDVIRPRRMASARLAGALVLIVVPLLFDARSHPGLPALAVCVATVLLLVPGCDLRASPPLAPVVMLGDRSYSLYLVHWPVFAFANNVYLGPVPAAVNAALLLVCLAWMEAQYRVIEQPLRTMRINRRRVAILAAIPVVVVGASLARLWLSPPPALTVVRDLNYGIAQSCDFGADGALPAACSSGPHPTTLVWGDSFAMQLGDGLAVSQPRGVVQATRAACGPFLDIAPMNGELQPRAWAKRCMAFNRAVIDQLARWPDVRTVVLSSVMTQYLPGAETGHWRLLARRGTDDLDLPQSQAAMVDGLARTIAAVRALGKRVILVAPPPAAGFDIARCQARRSERLPSVSDHTDCTFSQAEYRDHREKVLSALAEVARRDVVPILWFDPWLCRDGRCRTTIGSTGLYRDAGHLSAPGSRAIGRAIALGTLVEQRAR